MLLFLVPAAVLLSGAEVSTAPPAIFLTVFVTMLLLRMWGSKQLYRGHLSWSSAFVLRMFRIPIGFSCAWWILTRRTLTFEVTPKAGDDERVRGRTPGLLLGLIVLVNLTLLYAVAGALGLVPWRSSPSATVASASWLVIADIILVMGTRRITDPRFASSRRNAHRTALQADVVVAGVAGRLVDVSVGGIAVRFPAGTAPLTPVVRLHLPGAPPVDLDVVRISQGADGDDVLSARVGLEDWAGYGVLSRWLFHTPPGAVAGIPDGVPAVAATPWRRQPHAVRSFNDTGLAPPVLEPVR